MLPKFGVSITLDKEWVLAGEKIVSRVRADYTYGKPVQGEMELRASRYLNGTWQEFARLSRTLNGQTSFELPGLNAFTPGPNGRAEVQRVRQFFPETWLWSDVQTDLGGKGSQSLQAPDSLTTWNLQAVALSPTAGLGMAQAELKVLQPFFVQLDLVYAAIRGEELPVKVALYNYTAQSEEFTVELEKAAWFDLLDNGRQTLTVGPNDLGSLAFPIRPTELGTHSLKLTARSRSRADALVKDLLVEPEGVAREEVENVVIEGGKSYELDLAVPAGIVVGSARTHLALTGNYLSQTIEGLENLLQVPYGCGEQNMMMFAPDVYITQYLNETGQGRADVLARAESLMLTGYQRELTYRRRDGSYSAFGDNDPQGSLWLSAFVLKTFAQAKNMIFVDGVIQSQTREWIGRQQKNDGSFEPVGFVHNQGLLGGGLRSKTALTAYMAVVLLEVGDKSRADRSIAYLEKNLDGIGDAYTLALTSYALELGHSSQATAVYGRLVATGQPDADGTGLFWGGQTSGQIQNSTGSQNSSGYSSTGASVIIETTGYALLALNAHGDRLTASRAARWLVLRRNSKGGWISTQDSVVSLQALTTFVVGSKNDLDASVKLRAGDWTKGARLGADNADVVQIIDLPGGSAGGKVQVEMVGRGQAILQTVRRYNLPDPQRPDTAAFSLDVDYGLAQAQVSKPITVKANVQYRPPQPQNAGMVVLEIALPTGFGPVEESLAALAKAQPRLRRYDTVGRKVLLYLDDMLPDEKLSLQFQAQAGFAVKAQAVTSQAYAYYRPEWKGEHLGGAMSVSG